MHTHVIYLCAYWQYILIHIRIYARLNPPTDCTCDDKAMMP